MTSRNDVQFASLLVRHALDRDRPRPDSSYAALLARYQTDSDFAETVTAICEGLGLYVLGTSPAGLIVHADSDGPFRVTLDNSGLNLRDLNHRFVYPLVLAGVAAYAYRDTDSLTGSASVLVRAPELEKFINRAVDSIAGDGDGDGDGDPGDDWEYLLGVAGRQWKERPGIHLTPQGRPKVGCHRWYSTTALDWLADNHMAVRQPALQDDNGNMAYQLTDRFRFGIAELEATDAFAVLRSTVATEPTDTGSPVDGPGADETPEEQR